MPSIEGLRYPLVFPVSDTRQVEPDPVGTLAVHTEVRSLEGMQKEALVRVGSGRTWRMVSDEGPYLDGTDLAPFPLAFFSAGLQFSLLSQLVQGARARSVDMGSVALTLDTLYSMEGSFLRGDAEGGAMPARVELSIESDADAGVVADLVRGAAASSGAHAVMRDVLANVFALTHNGTRIEVEGLPASRSTHDEAPSFEWVAPESDHAYPEDIITKVGQAEKLHGVEGGAGSSLNAEQKRTLHVHGEARVTDGLAMETEIRLFKPIGSSFRFLCDETSKNGGAGRAPSPLAYLAAGVGFCYMTQLGRYAHILKKELTHYSLVQTNACALHGSFASGTRSAGAEPFDTHVFMESEETDAVAGDFLRTGARTCFLHAAMRGRYPTDVRLSLNGDEVAL